MMRTLSLLGFVLMFGACNIPPKDPFVAAERALASNDLLEALQAYDAVPVKHARYPDARAAAGDVEQRMRRCHELILEALMLRAEWRDAEALETLRRAADHWPGQPSLRLWMAATEKRLRLFGDRTAEVADRVTATPASPLIEIAKPGQQKPSGVVMSHGVPAPVASAGETGAEQLQPMEVPSRGPLPMVPLEPRSAREPTPTDSASSVATADGVDAGTPSEPTAAREVVAPIPSRSVVSSAPEAGSTMPVALAPPSAGKPEAPMATALEEAAPDVAPAGTTVPTRRVAKPRRLPMSQDPVALGMVSVEAALGRGELPVAVRDLIELARRFPGDARVNRRLGRLLHQRALMHYGSGAVAAAVADWRRVLKIEPANKRVKRLLARALAESQAK